MASGGVTHLTGVLSESVLRLVSNRYRRPRERHMRVDTKMRDLSSAEIALARSVFQDSLPAWSRIKITDGLGPLPTYDRPYTTEDSPWFFLHLGPDMYPDATLPTVHPEFGQYRHTYVHEMTHVWQYYHGYWVVLRSAWANSRWGAGYDYTIGPSDAWDDYNVEQQAHLVEDWFAGGMSTTDDRFVFVEKIIRTGITGGFWASMWDTLLIKLPLEKLREINA